MLARIETSGAAAEAFALRIDSRRLLDQDACVIPVEGRPRA